MTEAITNAVLAAISDITGKIGSIKKAGHNSFHNYAFATAADILHKLQPMLADAGLVIIPTQKELRFLDQQQSVIAVDYEFALYHKSGIAHPDKPIITGMANARNTKGGFDDKAANKCLTAAHKYFLLTLFKIPTGDYDDADADADVETPKAKPNGKSAEHISAEQAKTIRLAIKEVDADEELFARYFQVPSVNALPVGDFQRALEAIDAKRRKTK